MRADTHARLTLLTAMLLGLVPVSSWQRGEIDVTTMATRLAIGAAVAWAVLLLVGRVLTAYRSADDQAQDGPRRRAEDLAAGPPGLADADA